MHKAISVARRREARIAFTALNLPGHNKLYHSQEIQYCTIATHSNN